ncbi:unnamed protein product [Cylindrotheca closterium]|uniref:Uncharacterized protein n=1 Tax=Cylindrotheca closterium TaxID=2856 RepID=A0AAD2GD17_9STRA|nr:unnamed protein product [Cylindrotheca closterium]
MKEYRNKIVVLASSFTIDDEQNVEQTQAISLLTTRKIPFEVVDAFDPTMMKRRTQLQKLMPDSAQYPQFFVVDDNEVTSYVGELGRLQDIDEDSGLSDSVIGAHPLIMTWERLLGAGYRNKLLLLISTMKVCRKQHHRQDRAMQILRAKRIPFDTVDAADQTLIERRNELFEISGIRGQYPQFFLTEKTGETHYIGDWDTIENINDTSGLPQAMIETNPGAVTWDRLLNAGVAM